ncbi:MAG: tripartite tricarboxylate transporter TctB family protein [Rhodospirillales bacterium]|nr:tripartite tricarboxylate transporter TctB family protein [Rhodospirillales bacterium]
MPWSVAWAGIGFGLMHFTGRFVSFGGEAQHKPADVIEAHAGEDLTGIVENIAALPTREMARRAANFLAWCLLYLALTALVGLLPAMFIFLVAYMRFQGKESWRLSLTVSIPTLVFAYVVFHQVVAVVWPKSFLGDLFPIIRSIQPLSFV